MGLARQNPGYRFPLTPIVLCLSETLLIKQFPFTASLDVFYKVGKIYSESADGDDSCLLCSI